ncbi:hypothetical protein D9615_002642 [Tricholomella constricta]|uniref:HNH nuclease domain-containing protein n=1 Tax=Tricholomella constricta TaxID=117010 RepID=A0A8H5HMV9_9AGAR|nr:hypothetical protein D9615_002642 [Tricholomella constricta]
MANTWTPTPLALGTGIPVFQYDNRTISTESGSEAFETGISHRDNERCIVCGVPNPLEYVHIVPKEEDKRWEFLRAKGLIPSRAKSVVHEPRNGILLCLNHQVGFERHQFYIRWVPTFQRFIFINHSASSHLEKYHGRAVRLFPDDSRTPFHGSFVDHEMRVRGQYPYGPEFVDRPVNLPIQWQPWIDDIFGKDSGGSHSRDGGKGRRGQKKHTSDDEMEDMSLTVVSKHTGQQDGHDDTQFNAQLSQQPEVLSHLQPSSQEPATSITFMDPMANPAELEAIMCSARQQPNWRAAMIEGETWEGTAIENIEKYNRLNPPADAP